ncbi:MAG: Arc family DNA binding domain-containing protein [Pseudomonadota bacterium]
MASAKKKPFALRISPNVMQAMQRWADDDLRSLNAQIEWVLREGLRKAGRLKTTAVAPVEDDAADTGDSPDTGENQ